MWHENRRVVLHPHVLAVEAYAEARADLHALAFAHRCALADLQREVDGLNREVGELRGVLGDVVAILRGQAEADVARLRRELGRVLLRLVPPTDKPLN